MTVFFTKTCARDWERCCYQMLAIRRRFPLATHVVLLEARELFETHDLDFVDSDLDIALAQSGALGPRTEIYAVERLMPEAMKIEDPYLRQQYCKLRAPVVLGEDTIQLDSDMCPKPGLRRWADELFGSDLRDTAWVRWNAPVGDRTRQYAIENWNRGFKSTGLENAPGVFDSNIPKEQDFMGAQLGWYVQREAARNFLRALGDPIERMLDVVRFGYKFSEYQFLGMYAYATGRYRYRFIPRAEQDPWLLHFTSTEKLTDDQRVQLREAAGLEE